MKPDYFLIPRIVREAKGTRPADWLVYATIYWLEHMRGEQCYASNATIARASGISARTVGLALEHLEKAKLIERAFVDRKKTRRAQIHALVFFSQTPSLFKVGSTGVLPDSGTGVPAVGSIGVLQSIKKKEIVDTTIAATSAAPFVLKEEIKKMEESSRRDINVIALYLEQRRPDIKSKEQLHTAIKRHLRPAKLLSPFNDDQILRAVQKAKREYPEWTIETLVKIATK